MAPYAATFDHEHGCDSRVAALPMPMAIISAA